MDCSEPIPSERLQAVPRTRRCQPCAGEVERR
ncbi:MAG: TraR/DksA C4-type zinc finger protein [Stenotrophomonas sp.]